MTRATTRKLRRRLTKLPAFMFLFALPAQAAERQQYEQPPTPEPCAASQQNVANENAAAMPPLEAGHTPEPLTAPELQHFGAAGSAVELEELAPVDIIDLQERLRALDLYRGDIDGIAGPQTRYALALYFTKQAERARQGQLSTAAMELLTSIPR
jgi:hypothetical protein